ncbi:MAG: 3-oxoacyl-ACP synthase III family protein [Bacteroidales bacterium]
MPYLTFQNIGITGIAAAVPRTVINNYRYTSYFPEKDVKDIVDKIGVIERRFADENTCSSDLCFAAAEKLMVDMEINREEIGLLIFMSQTPDYRMPATSILLQERLRLPRNTITFDVSLGCSGFIYALSLAFAFMQSQPSIKKALVLDGETRSKVYSPKDRKTAFLFGDAGVAALVERNEKFGKSWFSMNIDGSQASLIKIEAGGYRMPSSEETVKERVVDEYGNIRSLEQAYMNGGDVFNFVIREVPRDFNALLSHAGIEASTIDYFVFHQANSYINNYLVKKLKIDPLRVPSTIAKFGNTSSVSIPLTIVSELKDKLSERKNLLLCGFGVGLSWATSIITVDQCHISDIIEI